MLPIGVAPRSRANASASADDTHQVEGFGVVPGAGVPGMPWTPTDRVHPEGAGTHWQTAILGINSIKDDDQPIRLLSLLWASLGARKGASFADVAIAVHSLRTFDPK